MSSDFWKFWVGQTISNLGSSFTQWAVPLLVYQLTHSAVSLGVATAATFLPYLLFGLPLGAWMDRVDRKRAMIALDAVNADYAAHAAAARETAAGYFRAETVLAKLVEDCGLGG